MEEQINEQELLLIMKICSFNFVREYGVYFLALFPCLISVITSIYGSKVKQKNETIKKNSNNKSVTVIWWERIHSFTH